MIQNDVFLSKLNDKILLLVEQFSSATKVRRNSPCFDVQLFNYQGPLLSGYAPYLAELQTNYQKLANLVHKEDQTLHIDPIIYLSQLIVHQLEALQRELATLPLRKAEKSIVQSETLHEQYAKNLGYLNRLEAMKYQLQQSAELNSIEKDKQLLIIENRLARCRDYLLQLEQRIERS